MATKLLAAAAVALSAVVLVPGASASGMTATGAASPSTVAAGGSTLLTVTVTPPDGQSGDGIAVACNLAPIGGGLTIFHDDGTNGDVAAADLTFSDLVTIPDGTPDGTLDFFCLANLPGFTSADTDIFVTVSSAPPVNEPPTVDAGGPYTVNEGGSVTLAASGSDPEGGALTYAWDLDDNGSFETPGQSVSFSPDDGHVPAVSVTVKVQVTDDGGLSAVSDASVTVMNVPPTATFAAPTSVDAGFPLMLSLSTPGDPSTADTNAGFTYAFDCGDGNGLGSFSAASSQACPATDVGTLLVTAEIKDKDGGITQYTGSVDVTVTFDSLCELARAYSTDPKLADNLCDKLDAAENASEPTAKAGSLGAFRNMVSAKVGKGLTAWQAGELKRLSCRL